MENVQQGVKCAMLTELQSSLLCNSLPCLQTEMPFCSLGPPDAIHNPLSVPPIAQGVAVAEQLPDWCQVVGALCLFGIFSSSPAGKQITLSTPRKFLRSFHDLSLLGTIPKFVRATW